MYIKHVSFEYTYTGSTILWAHLKENILIANLIYFYRVSERLYSQAITKTRLDDATRIMVTVAPLRVTRRKEEKKKRWCLALAGETAVNDSSPRAGRRRRMSFCATIIACVHHPSTFSQIGRDRSRRDTHYDDDDDDDGGSEDDEPAQGRPVAHSQKFFTANELTPVWCTHGGISRRADDLCK